MGGRKPTQIDDITTKMDEVPEGVTLLRGAEILKGLYQDVSKLVSLGYKVDVHRARKNGDYDVEGLLHVRDICQAVEYEGHYKNMMQKILVKGNCYSPDMTSNIGTIMKDRIIDMARRRRIG